MQDGNEDQVQPGTVRRSARVADQSAGSSPTPQRPSSLKDFRVAALRNNRSARAQQKGSKPTTSQPGSSAADRPLAPSSDSGHPLSDEQFNRLRDAILAEVTPLCVRVVSNQLSEQLPVLQEAVQPDLEQIQSAFLEQVPPMIENRLTEVQLEWEKYKPDALVTLERRFEETRSRLLGRIDVLEGELEAASAEIDSLKAHRVQARDGESVSERSRKRRNSSRKTKSKSRHSRRRDDGHSSSSSMEKFDDSDRDTSSSDSSRSSRGRSSRRKTLTELNPSNRRFRKVLSYKRYRLDDRNKSQGSRVRKKVSTWTKRMITSVSKFTGNDPISVLKFIATFRSAANNNGIPEGGAFLVLRNFLGGKAAVAYEASLEVDAAGAEGVGISSWPDAVHWLLQTYAKDIYIQRAVAEIRALRQGDNETEYDFGHRVLKLFSRMPGVYPQADQVAAFVEGLPEVVAAGVIRDRQVNPSHYETLQDVLDLADSHGVVERSRKAHTEKPKKTRGVYYVDSNPGSTPTSSTYDSGLQPDNAILAVEQGMYSPPSYATTPSTTTYHTSDLSYGINPNMEQPISSQEPSPTSGPAAVLPIVSNHNPRLEPHAQPYRPGWVDNGSYPRVLKNPRQHSAGNDVEHRSCFLCANVSHYIMDCPLVSDAMRIEARRNIAEASPQQRRFLPRWTYALASVPYPFKQEGQPPKATRPAVDFATNSAQAPNVVSSDQGKVSGT